MYTERGKSLNCTDKFCAVVSDQLHSDSEHVRFSKVDFICTG